jgi:hypothetical protein
MPSLRDRVKAQRELPTANTAGAEAFIDAANAVGSDAPARPWQAFEKKAVPRTTFNLRLNDYELALLRWLAEQRDESMQKVAKRVLIPALERLVEETSG